MSWHPLELAGTAALVRMTLRRERLRVALWVLAILAMVWASAISIQTLFPTQADLDVAAEASDNPAITAFNGPPVALDTLGGQTVFQIGAPGLVMVALMSTMVTNRLTRKEEESGRLEMVRSLPVGRHAPIASSVLIGLAMCLAVGVGSFAGLASQGLATSGSIIFGLQVTSVGAVFVGVALVAAQVTENSRIAGGVSGGVLAVAFALRAIGDMTNGALSWLSPIGWVQKASAFGEERWWPFLLSVVALLGLLGAAVSLLNHRDLGAGMFSSRPGPASAGPRLSTPLGLAIRLQRGSVAGWSVGVAGAGLVYGLITTAIEGFVEDNPSMADVMASVSGATITESYLSTSTHATAIIASGFAVQSILRLRNEETSQRAEPVLATAVSRIRWISSHLAVALLGSVIVLAVLGLSLGLSAAATTDDLSIAGDVFVASLAHVPALWFLIGLAVLLIGFVPRYAMLAWAAYAVGLTVAFFGTLLRLPSWAIKISPFEQIPLIPAESFAPVPIIVLTLAAGACTAVGISGLARRDIGSA